MRFILRNARLVYKNNTMQKHTPIDTDKVFDKTQHPFMLRALRKLKQRNFLNHIKGNYKNFQIITYLLPKY